MQMATRAEKKDDNGLVHFSNHEPVPGEPRFSIPVMLLPSLSMALLV